MRAWLFQDYRQKQKLGDKCPWSVGWYEDGKKRNKSIGCKSLAEKYARKLESQADAGLLATAPRKAWASFREEWEAQIGSTLHSTIFQCSLDALKHFEAIVNPGLVSRIKSSDIDQYIATRRKGKGKKTGDTVAVATINKELRHLKSILSVAKDWGYLLEQVKFRMLREPKQLPVYVTPDHFAAIYASVSAATLPKFQTVQWWQTLLVFARLTGWRVGEILALRVDDIDLETGTAITRHADNKGKRDEIVPIHPLIVDHIRQLSLDGVNVLPWPHHYRTLWVQFSKVQQAAGIHLPCHEDHTHTDACHLYGFHDLRRAFATDNASRLSGEALQRLMRHKSYQTTQGYINMAGQLNQALDRIGVPECLRPENGLSDEGQSS